MVLPRATEACLHTSIQPEALEDTGELCAHVTLINCARQRKQLPCIVLHYTHTQTEITIKSHYRHFCWGISFFPPSALIATVDLAHCSLLSLTGEAQGWKMAALEHGHLPRLVLTARAASANSISSRSMALTMIIKDWVVLLYTTALNWWHSSSE